MTVVHCPKCREEVSVPPNASDQARVRCPLCSEEYLLADALQALPPKLVILHDPQPLEDYRHSETAAAPAFAPVDHDDSSDMVVEAPTEEFSFEPVDRPAPAFKLDESPARPATRVSSSSGRSRSRRKQSSPIKLIVQTIGGGVMGLLIAQLILWWMPGNWEAQNRDPFQLAVKVARVAPFIVPATLRGVESTADATRVAPAAGTSNQNAGPLTSSGGEGATGTQPELNTQIPDFTFDPNAATPPSNEKKKSNGKATTAKSAPKTDVVKSSPTPETEQPLVGGQNVPDLSLDPDAQKEKTPSPSKEKSPEPSTAPTKEAPQELVSLRNAPDVKVSEIAERLADFEMAEAAWDNADKPTVEKKTQLITALYDQLSKLGDAVAVTGLNQPQPADSLKPVADKLKSLTSQADKLVPIGRLAGLRLPEMQDQGATLYGSVLAHRSSGRMFETDIRLNAKSEPVVTIISSTDLSQPLPVGTNAIVIGRMVGSPSENLVGYEGKAEKALLHGMHVTVP